MKHRPHILRDHIQGKYRIRACIYPCFREATEVGSFYSDRFKVRFKSTVPLGFIPFPDAKVIINNIFQG